jgi:hypothetical protein
MQVTAGPLVLIKFNQNPGFDRFPSEEFPLGGGPIAPKNVIGLTEAGGFFHEVDDVGIRGGFLTQGRAHKKT